MAHWTVFTTLHFPRTLNIRTVIKTVTLHFTESPANNKHSSFLGQFVSYKDIVVNTAPLTVFTTLYFLCILKISSVF